MKLKLAKKILRVFKHDDNYIMTSKDSSFVKDEEVKLSYVDVRVCHGSNVILEKGVKLSNVYINLNNGSVLTIKSDTELSDVSISIIDNSQMVVGNSNKIETASYSIVGGGRVMIGDNNVITCGDGKKASFLVEKGEIWIGKCNRILNSFWIRFGGRTSIGNYNLINQGTLMRCDESIVIGSYNLISRNCDVWDTNTHARYSFEERKRLSEEKGTPFVYFINEKNKPITKPVVIGDGLWMGEKACILKGCEIGDNVTIGTRAIVSNMKVPDNKTVVPPKSIVI